MPHLHKMQVTGLPHMGNMLTQVMKLRMITVTELAGKMNLTTSSITEYKKQSTLHAALLWKLGEILEYDFFAALSREFPLHTASDKELELQQQLDDLKKENVIYQKILAGKLSQ